VFGMRRQKGHSELAKLELGQSAEHLKQAAAHAAQATSATVGPKLNAARDRVQPVAVKARDRVQPVAVKARDSASTGWDSAVAALAPLIAAAADRAQLTGKDAKTQGKQAVKANKKNAAKLQKRADKTLGRKQGRSKSKLFGLALAGAAVGAGAAFVLKRRRAAQWEEYDPAAPVGQTTSAGDAALDPAPRTSGTRTSETLTTETLGTSGAVSAGGATGSTGTTGSLGSTGSLGTDPVTADTLASDTTDQTSSALHSPTVAKMAHGDQKN
jgi:hypothetical protein